ncbi:hypothetical protein [Bosea lathyri]|uniref:Uncharacterized protein n=1 Tax=Bosea lathyri TaxID=1036778 RepID=A0A1H6BFA6_9HYPH|nr:hypothetical protein [Bosea lathyri]SEG59274.1 hypothetical protein SAMN04488115_107187 [Bosea lathyri]
MATGYYILSGVSVVAGDTVLTATHLAAPDGAAEPINFAQLIGGEGAEGTPAGFILIGPAGQTAIARHTVDNHTVALGAPWVGPDIAVGACLLVLGINALPIGRLATLITQLSVSRPMLAANRLIEFAGDPEAQAAVRANLAISAANTPFTPAGGISALTVQAALVELDGEKASATAVADQVAIVSGQVAAVAGQVDTIAGQVAALADDVDAVAGVANGAASGLAALGTATADALAKRLRVDAVQSFSTPEKLQGRQNLGVGGAVDDFVVATTLAAARSALGVRAAVIGEKIAGQFTSLPALSVWANGQNLSRTTYALLFAATTVACNTYTTNASAAAQIALASTQLAEAIAVGMPIEGAGIQAGTTVAAIVFVSGTTYNVTLSLTANATQSGGAGRVFPNGNGNGSTTFGVADYRDRASVGRGNMGGTAASRLTGAISGIDSSRLGVGGGNQNPAPQTQIGRFGTPNPAGVTWLDFVPGDTSTYAVSADAATNGTGTTANVQPSIIENVAIYAGV